MRALETALEAVVLLLVTVSPWLYGAADPAFEFVLDAGIAVVGALWGLRMLLEGRLTWRRCPLTLCLAGLFLVGALQLVALPGPVLAWLSPATVRTYQELLPPEPELLPGGEVGGVPRPAGDRALSLYPEATRQEPVPVCHALVEPRPGQPPAGVVAVLAPGA